MPETFRCSVASEAAGEEIAGTAPSDIRWLLVEQPIGWEREAAATLPPRLRERLDPSIRMQLIRRPGGGTDGPGLRVMSFDLSRSGSLRTSVLASPADLDALDPEQLDGPSIEEPLFLVCTHGRRDVCCAERGRPVAAALATAHPGRVWETTHLGGHRFAGTALALPWGIGLGRLDADSALACVETLIDGRWPLDHVRGRAGLPGHVQWAELEVRRGRALTGHDDVHVLDWSGDGRVVLDLSDGRLEVAVVTTAGPAIRASCGEAKVKPVPAYAFSAQ